MSMIIGVIAEDISDVDVVKELIKKILSPNKTFNKVFYRSWVWETSGKMLSMGGVLEPKDYLHYRAPGFRSK